MLGEGSTTWESVGDTWGVIKAAQSNPNEDWFSFNQVRAKTVPRQHSSFWFNRVSTMTLR
jgi:hypothetical protein